MSLAKTAGIGVLTLQQVAANAVVNGSAVDVSSYVSLSVFMNLGRDDTGGALTVGAIFRLQASAKDSGDEQWFDLATFQSGVTVPEPEAVSGTVGSGTAVVTVASTTNFAQEQIVFIKNGTLANSEFHRVKTVTSNTSLTLDDTLTNAQTGATVYNQAERYVAAALDIMSIKRVRLQVDNAQNGRTIIAEAFAVGGAI